MEKSRFPDAPPAYDSPPPYISTQPTASSSATVTVIEATTIGRFPVHITCPNCRILIATRLEMKPTSSTHICALVSAIFCCWPFVCCAYCAGAFYTIDHYCPNCDTFIGTYQTKCNTT